jgi:hypothetical protein
MFAIRKKKLETHGNDSWHKWFTGDFHPYTGAPHATNVPETIAPKKFPRFIDAQKALESFKPYYRRQYEIVQVN